MRARHQKPARIEHTHSIGLRPARFFNDYLMEIVPVPRHRQLALFPDRGHIRANVPSRITSACQKVAAMCKTTTA